MSIDASPAAIRDFGADVGSLPAEADQACSYADRWLGIGYAEGRMFASVVETASSVRQALERNYARLAELTSASATELDRTADQYETTDAEVAVRLRSIARDGDTGTLDAAHLAGR